jgi:hypothetical protein
MRIRTAAVTVLAVGLLLAGCSSGGDKSPTRKPAATTTAASDHDDAGCHNGRRRQGGGGRWRREAYTKAFFAPDADSRLRAAVGALPEAGTSLADDAAGPRSVGGMTIRDSRR